jgi:serine phosphatase RsbU (regulator of sigma subunit)
VLAGQISGAECATVACALLDPVTGQLGYATAGHPPILIGHAGGGTTYLNGGRGLPLGIAPSPRPSATTQLAAGDVLVLYTDGLYERRQESPDEGLNRLAALAAKHHGLPPTELSQALADGMLAGAEPDDDICVLVAAPELGSG